MNEGNGGGARGSLVIALTNATGGSEVSCVDLAGARLAAGGGRALRVWRWVASTGWLLEGTSPNAHRYGVTCARWAPAGALLCSGGVDGVLRLWGCPELTERAALAAAGAAAVRAICWAGSRLIAGHDDGAVTIWLWARGELAAVLRAHAGSLHALACPARGALLVTVCTEGVLKLHDMEEVCAAGCDGSEGSESSEVTPLAWEDGAHDLGALCASTAEPLGTLLATGGHDARVRVWSVTRDAGADGRRRGAIVDAGYLDGHEGAVTGVRWGAAKNPDGTWMLATSSLDRTARVWSVPEGNEGGVEGGTCVLMLHAHARYLTCIALDPDLRFLVTGSNDKSVRTWSLGALSVDDALRPPCAPLQHFALGDLEGIGPVAEVPVTAESAGTAREGWRGRPHSGAINCLASQGDLLASASSDGTVRIFRWEENDEGDSSTEEESGKLEELRVLEAHDCAVAAVAWGEGKEEVEGEGATPLLLSAALDGHTILWDVEAGAAVRSTRLSSGTGGGGVRGATLAGARLLLAAGDHDAPLWDLDQDSPAPAHVYCCGGAARCCAWSGDARLLALGGGGEGAAGELRLYASPPSHALRHLDARAHDIEIESVAWSATAASVGAAGGGRYALASAGADELVKLWLVQVTGCEETEDEEVSVSLVRVIRAHGGGVRAVSWGGLDGTLLGSGGGDGWARLWAPREAPPRTALPAPMGGVLSLAFLHHEGTWLMALGGMDGSLSVWRLGAAAAPCGGSGSGGGGGVAEDEGEGADPRCWGAAGVQRWLLEYVTRAPGCRVSAEREAALLAAGAALAGARLLDDPLEQLMEALGYGEDEEILAEQDKGAAAVRERLRDELLWLRRDPDDHETESGAPHSLQCPVRHAAWREPARAADGVTYDRAALTEHWRAKGGAVCALDGAKLAHRRVAPNYRAREALRNYLRAKHDGRGEPGGACAQGCYFCSIAPPTAPIVPLMSENDSLIDLS